MKTRAHTLLKDIKSNATTFVGQLQASIKNIKEIYEEDVLTKNEELLTKIANDYSLDLNELKRRYLKNKKKTNNAVDTEVNGSTELSDHESVQNTNHDIEFPSLYKYELNGNVFYIEMVNGGKIFDCYYNEVGIWRNEMVEIDMELVEKLKKQKKQSKKDNLSITIESFIKSTEESIEKTVLPITSKKIIVEM
jgi:hypothetical protein